MYATQAHFNSVVALLNDLNEKRKEFQNPGHAAGWWETYAKRISRLPVANVDEDMLEYSSQVADHLRAGAQQGRGAGIRTGVRQAQDTAGSTYGGYDYWGYRDNAARRRAIRSEETGQVALAATEISKQIQDLTEQIRRKMTVRYKVEF